MRLDYPETMTMREARRRYFEANHFGIDGGYNDAWVDFKLGPVPFPFPNTKSRVRAVRYHDLHHILTGYGTDNIGEFEMAAWEIAAGCKSYAVAWILNLGGLGTGAILAPRRVFNAFVRGSRSRSLYGEPLEEILDSTVGEVRARYMPRAEEKARRRTVATFAMASAAGVIVGVLSFATVAPLVPFGLLANTLRKRAKSPTVA